jgi:hypothetical protein
MYTNTVSSFTNAICYLKFIFRYKVVLLPDAKQEKGKVQHFKKPQLQD